MGDGLPGCAAMVVTAVVVILLLIVLALIGPPDCFRYRTC
jgi:hypothetical protein